jgi:hypothetical protein
MPGLVRRFDMAKPKRRQETTGPGLPSLQHGCVGGISEVRAGQRRELEGGRAIGAIGNSDGCLTLEDR